MALTIRLTDKELQILESVKKLLGRSHMPSSTAIIMLITTFEEKEKRCKALEQEVQILKSRLEKAEETLYNYSSAINGVLNYGKKDKKQNLDRDGT